MNEEIVYFIFQLELDAQLQRALNYEAYEAAQQIRSKRETVRVGRSFRAVGSVTVAGALAVSLTCRLGYAYPDEPLAR